ncbi:MAG: LPP20 family lipoprotein [Candidatus Omnitrophota bacterium]
MKTKRNGFSRTAVWYRIINMVLMSIMIWVPVVDFAESPNPGPDDSTDLISDLGNGASMNWTKMVLRVTGNGFGTERVADLGRRKKLAQRAAQLDAYRNLLEAVKGVRVTSDTTVEDLMLSDDSIRASAEGMVKGMQVVKVAYANDGGCTVTVEINLDESGNFLLAALNDRNVKVKDNYPTIDWVAQRKELNRLKRQYASQSAELNERNDMMNQANQEVAILKKELNDQHVKMTALLEKKESIEKANYTGILVDARGLDLKPAMATSIYTENNGKMCGIGNSPGKTGKDTYLRGNVEWVKKNKNEKIGPNPLVVKCIKPVNQSDLMISNEDAQKIEWISGLLGNKKFSILM